MGCRRHLHIKTTAQTLGAGSLLLVNISNRSATGETLILVRLGLWNLLVNMPRPRIDTHAHIIPPFYREALQQAGHSNLDGMPGIPVRSAPLSASTVTIALQPSELEPLLVSLDVTSSRGEYVGTNGCDYLEMVGRGPPRSDAESKHHKIHPKY